MLNPSKSSDEYWIVYGSFSPDGRKGEIFYLEEEAIKRYEVVADDPWSDMATLVHCQVLKRKTPGGS